MRTVSVALAMILSTRRIPRPLATAAALSVALLAGCGGSSGPDLSALDDLDDVVASTSEEATAEETADEAASETVEAAKVVSEKSAFVPPEVVDAAGKAFEVEGDLTDVYACPIPSADMTAEPTGERQLLDVEKSALKFGFIKLTDCAPLVIAKEKGFFKDEGLDVEVIAQPNWKTLLNGVIDGGLDGAHMLSGSRSPPRSVSAPKLTS